MNTKILSIILHVGKVIQTVKDLETAVGDLTKGDYQKSDVAAILTDVSDLVSDGVISIPDMTTEQVQSAIAEFQKAL